MFYVMPLKYNDILLYKLINHRVNYKNTITIVFMNHKLSKTNYMYLTSY